MGDITRDYKRSAFPLTNFLCRLVMMTDAELRVARPMRAANTFGIDPNVAAEYIRDQQAGKGMEPMEWTPIQWPPTLAQYREMRQSNEEGSDDGYATGDQYGRRPDERQDNGDVRRGCDFREDGVHCSR